MYGGMAGNEATTHFPPSQIMNRVCDEWREVKRNKVSVMWKNPAFPELQYCERFDGRWTMYEFGKIISQGRLT